MKRQFFSIINITTILRKAWTRTLVTTTTHRGHHHGYHHGHHHGHPHKKASPTPCTRRYGEVGGKDLRVTTLRHVCDHFLHPYHQRHLCPTTAAISGRPFPHSRTTSPDYPGCSTKRSPSRNITYRTAKYSASSATMDETWQSVSRRR
jgi:hypothetical protein